MRRRSCRLIAEPSTKPLQSLALGDSSMIVWWGAEVECTSALARLKHLASAWHEVEPGDALQLATAFVAAERRPVSLEVVTLDDRLAAAARKEGFMLADLLPGAARSE